MKQIDLLKKIIYTPGMYANEAQRAQAKAALLEKQKRRDRKIMHQTQLRIDGHGRF